MGFYEPAARVGQKSPAHLTKRGAGSLSDRKSQSIVRLLKDQGGSSVLLDTPVVNCLFNRRQYYFVIGPIPVFYAQAADGGPTDRVRRGGLCYLKHHTKAGWNSWRAVQNMTAGKSLAQLLLCAKHLFVAAMMAGVHPGPAANRQNRP